MHEKLEMATEESGERARLHGGRSEQVTRDLKELAELQRENRPCDELLCPRKASRWHRDSAGQWTGLCRVHSGTPLERTRALLDEARRK